jgi:uncharacterized protein YjiS (DUF1127 family)
MLDILLRSVARAAGVEAPDGVQMVERPPSRPSVVKRLAAAFERWNLRRSTYLTLRQLDDRMLKDIGLDRGMLHEVAGKMARHAAANDNVLPIALSDLAANDNEPPASKRCI